MATAQLVTGVDFVGVPTRDLDAAVEFYGTAMGLPRSVYLKERSYSGSCCTPRCRPTSATIIATAMIAAIAYITERVA